MDPDIVVPAVFVLLLTLIIGGIILLFPLSRQLGRLIEWQIQEKKAGVGAGADELLRVDRRLSALEERLATIAERQEFVDRLLVEQRSPEPLPSATARE